MPFKDNGGFDKIKKDLKKIEDLKQIRFDELFNPKFLSECSSFSSIDELIEKSGFKVESAEDFKSIPDDEWERFIIDNTSYDSWDEMQKDAAEKFLQNLLKEG